MAERTVSDTTFDDVQYALPALGIERHFWSHARNRIVERHVRLALAEGAGSGQTVLDVGCGPGIVVDHLRRSRIDCHGVELGKPTVRPGLERFVTTATDAKSLPAKFRDQVGTILLLDVIEHIEAPSEFINDLLVNYPGVRHIVVTVPARQELWSNYDTYYGHFLRYDTVQFRGLATACNMDVRTLKYFFVGLYPAMRLLVKRSGERPLETRPPSGIAATVFNRLVGTMFVAEERLALVGRLPGTSLLGVLARKP